MPYDASASQSPHSPSGWACRRRPPGAPAKDKATDCIDYGDVTAAPAGTIPRDDLHVVHKDPLAGAMKSARAARTSARGKPGSGTTAAAFAPVTIPVRFHVIAKDRGQEGGDLSDARIAEQIQVLNEAYAPHGFSFVLEQVTRTYEPQWFNLIYLQRRRAALTGAAARRSR